MFNKNKIHILTGSPGMPTLLMSGGPAGPGSPGGPCGPGLPSLPALPFNTKIQDELLLEKNIYIYILTQL